MDEKEVQQKDEQGGFEAVMDSMIDLEFVPDTQRQLAKTYRSDVERHQTTRFIVPILFPGRTPNINIRHFFARRHFSSGPSFRSSNFPVTPGWFQTRSCCVFVILGRLQKMLFSDCFNVKYQHDLIAYKTCITVRFYVLTMTCYCKIQTVPSFHTRHMHV